MELNAVYVDKNNIAISTEVYKVITKNNKTIESGVVDNGDEAIMDIDTFRRLTSSFKRTNPEKDFVEQINNFLEFYNSTFA